VPHLPQKSDVEGFSVLQFAQSLESAFPHFEQKLFVEGFIVLHFEQRIGLSTEANDRLASCTTPVTQRALRTKPAGAIWLAMLGSVFRSIRYSGAADGLQADSRSRIRNAPSGRNQMAEPTDGRPAPSNSGWNCCREADIFVEAVAGC
jgi:hypothetical protein